MKALGPLLAGSLAIIGVAILLFVEDPAPGPLAAAHAAIEDGERLAGCVACHTPEGLDAGCLACHDEIDAQLRDGSGYHGALPRQACASCHADHHGRDFDLLALAWENDGRDFDHAHVAFRLADAHDDLACEKCHREARTFLGLDQECTTCHENVHRAERFADCTRCHDQAAFAPAAHFDHTPHLSLAHGHKGVACEKCHTGAAYDQVRGKRCADCHENPHRTPFEQDCEECHPVDARPWAAAATDFDHEPTGFALSPPHDDVACGKCHAGATRFRNPARTAENCRACHDDPHHGQFGARACTDCHEDHTFTPSRITSATHPGFTLRGAHVETACAECHRDGRFVDTPQTCAACHEDPHRGQFKGRGCETCHDERAFKPSHHDHRSFPLRGAHGEVACAKCHEGGRFAGTAQKCAACHEDPHRGQFKGRGCETCHDERAFLPSRHDHGTFPLRGAHHAVACAKCHENGRFAGTPRDCASCHTDVHGGQFGAKRCDTCHDTSSFRIRPFDHATRTKYALEGAHAKASCARCHETRRGVRRYRGAPTRCADCHDDAHRGQFKRRRCDDCHDVGTSFRVKSFDHARTRFPLDARHKDVACDQCHPTVRQRDGTAVVQYRPLGRQCGDCHDFK